MSRSEIAVTWLVADPGTPNAAIEGWCRDTVRATQDASVMVQMAGGRGRLAGGRGALVVAPERTSDGSDIPAWCVDQIDADFRLRQVHAPNGEPDLATTPAMLLTRTYVPDEMRDEFREWLRIEHSQRQLDVPGNNWYLGYEEVGPRHSFMNFWGIDDPGVAEGEAWDRQRLTPWRERMVPAMAGMDRGFYRPAGSSG
jgi:hypothetical protein